MPKKNKRTETRTSNGRRDVIDMLKEDHETVKSLFRAFENAKGIDQKSQIVDEAMTELNIHMALEEEIFYPALRGLLNDDEDHMMMDEALEEHHVVHLLIKELEAIGPAGERYEAKFTVLAENVRHHIGEEESKMLPKAEKTEADSDTIAQQIMLRKEALKKNYATTP